MDISNSILRKICNFGSIISAGSTVSSFDIRSGGYVIDLSSNYYEAVSTGARNANVERSLVSIIIPDNNVLESAEDMIDAINKSETTIKRDEKSKE